MDWQSLCFFGLHTFSLVSLSPSLSGYGLQLWLPSHCFLLFGWAACPGASRGSSPTLLISHPSEGINHPATMLSAALWSRQGPETVISLLLSGVPDIKAIKGCCYTNLALPLSTMQQALGKIQ